MEILSKAYAVLGGNFPVETDIGKVFLGLVNGDISPVFDILRGMGVSDEML